MSGYDAVECGYSLNDSLYFRGQQTIPFVEVVTTFCDNTLILGVPDIAGINSLVRRHAPVAVHAVPCVAFDALPLAPDVQAIHTAVSTNRS